MFADAVGALTEDQLIDIERRARRLTTSEKKARRDDGVVMLQLVGEVRALRDSHESVLGSPPASLSRSGTGRGAKKAKPVLRPAHVPAGENGHAAE